MNPSDLDKIRTCHRCGAYVHQDLAPKHREWHEQLEGTSERLTPTSTS